MKFNWTSARDEDLKSMSKTYSKKQAADKLGCTLNQVKYRCVVLDLSFQKYGETHQSSTVSNEDVFLIRELKKAGLTRKEISDKFEMKLHQIDAVLYLGYRKNDNYEPC